MKVLKTTLILFAFLFSFSNTVNAATVTWNGGLGDWSTASNWDTGTVPTAADDVVINSGQTIVSSLFNIHTLTIGVDANVTITASGFIHAITSVINPAITNNGYLGCKGLLQLETSYPTPLGNIGLQNFGTFILSGNADIIGNFSFGLKNESGGTATITGIINIEQSDYDSIENDGSMTNQGAILISNRGFSNSSNAVLENYGDIFISDISGIGKGCITNSGTLTNRSSGIITIQNHVSNTAAFHTWNNGISRNYGHIDISDVDNAMNTLSDATFLNEKNSSILIENVTLTGIRVKGTFRNKASIDINNSHTGLFVEQGFMVNHQKGILNIDDNNTAIRLYEGTSEMRNYGPLNLTNSTSKSIDNASQFSNRPMGRLVMDNIISIPAGGNFINQGHMKCTIDSGSNHWLQGTFTNTGILGDETNRFSNFTNQSIRARPITGSVQVGVPVTDALDVDGTATLTVLGWHTTETGGTSAGTYDLSSNSFTPNANAEGLTAVYVRVKVNTGKIKRFYKVTIENGVQPPPAPLMSNQSVVNINQSETFIEDDLEVKSTVQSQVNLFPNPTSQQINISGINGENVNIQLLDMQGRLVYKSYIGKVHGTQTLNRPDVFSGSYIIRVFDRKKVLLQKKIILL